MRFVLLSESCIPLFNFSFVYDYLITTSLSFLRMKSGGKLAEVEQDSRLLSPRPAGGKAASGWR